MEVKCGKLSYLRKCRVKIKPAIIMVVTEARKRSFISLRQIALFFKLGVTHGLGAMMIDTRKSSHVVHV